MTNTCHYLSEARLVQLLEQKGIGRPSTFSYIIDKIQSREYVKKQNIEKRVFTCTDYTLENNNIQEIGSEKTYGGEANKLMIQSLGSIITEYLYEYFEELFNINYTHNMELDLDKISNGLENWIHICEKNNILIHKLIYELDFLKIEYPIDESNSFIIGKYGPVIKCCEDDKTFFKAIKKGINPSLEDLKNRKYKIEDLIDITNANNEIQLINNDEITHEPSLYKGEPYYLKSGKFGLYVLWNKKNISLKSLGNRPIENISHEEVIQIIEMNNNVIRNINKDISIRKSKTYYIFYKTSKMKKPKFISLADFKLDIMTCSDEEIIEHVHLKNSK